MANRLRRFVFQGSGAALAAVIATASVSVPDHRAVAVVQGAENTAAVTDVASAQTTAAREGHFLVVTNTPAPAARSAVVHTWPY